MNLFPRARYVLKELHHSVRNVLESTEMNVLVISELVIAHITMVQQLQQPCAHHVVATQVPCPRFHLPSHDVGVRSVSCQRQSECSW